MNRRYIFLFIFCQLFFGNIRIAGADSVLAQDIEQMKAQMAVMQQKMAALEKRSSDQESKIAGYENSKQAYEQRIGELEIQLAKQATVQAAAVSQSRPAVGKWTPDIGVVADTLVTLNSAKEDEEGADRVSVREIELVVGSAIDPFSRLDAAIAFSDMEDPSLEEAYMTRFDLPGAMTARLGKFKPKVGKALSVHRDSLETVDEPLVIQRYFGHEGYNKSGFDLTKDLELPWDVTHQVSFGVLEGGNGEEGTAFGEVRRRPTIYGHLKNYVDLGEDTGLEGGLSYLTGSRDEDSSMEVRMLGLDGTLTHQLNANQAVKLQGEAFRLNRKESYAEVDDGLGGTMFVDARDNFWGAYGLADFRFHPRFSTGLRYDYVESVDIADDTDGDKGYTGYLTFYQSEFARWRTQFTHTDMATGKDDNAVYIQGTFAIGDHKHKIQ